MDSTNPIILYTGKFNDWLLDTILIYSAISENKGVILHSCRKLLSVVTCVGIFVRSNHDNDVFSTDEARLGGSVLQTISMRGGANINTPLPLFE